MIQVRGLGTAEVRAGDHRITPDSEMLFALALFLSVSAGERVLRARLLDLFWPDASDRSRRHALRQLLYRLRRSGFSLALRGDELLLDVGAVESDIRRVLEARWPEEAGAAEVAAAARLLPGYDPPMPEPYREWLDELRARVESQYRRAVIRQIGSARNDGRWRDVDDWARRCLDVDPLNEEATLARAEAIAMSGSKARALQVIDTYLHDLGDRGRVIGLPARLLRRRVSENSPETLGAERESVPLLGREREVARLNEMLHATLSGRGAATLVIGAPGIGKTRLVREVLASAGMRGWRSASARLQGSDMQRPLGVFVDLFGTLLQLSGALGSSPASLTQLRLLTEHVTGGAADAQRSQEAEAVQERLRAAAMDLLEAVVSEGPLVVLIEDLHWCDDASSRLMQYLVSRSADLPLFWALTARPDGNYSALRGALPDERVATMRLLPLSPADSTSLFELLSRQHTMRGGFVTSELAAAVTGGNPLFIQELARHVNETGQATSLPATLRALIRDRAARLSPAAQHVLHTCAMLGRYSSVARVSSVLEIGTPELLACLQELDALGIVGAGADADVLSLHDLWRDELLDSLLPASRKLLHHRCGLVLESECRMTRSPSVVWESARHLQAGGSEGRALGLLEECAQHQLDNGLPADAAKTFALAVQAARSDADRLRAISGQIAALRRAADWTEIARIVRPAIEISERGAFNTSPHSDLELLQIEAMWWTQADPCTSLTRALACAFDEAAPSGHRAHAALLSAIVADNICRFADLERLNVVAKTLFVSTHSDRASLLSVRLIYDTVLGSLTGANESAQQLVALERDTGSVRGLARALRFASYPLRLLGHFQSALASLTEALELAEHHHLVGDASSISDIILTIHVQREDLRAACSWVPRCAALASQVNAPYALASLAINRAIISLLMGEPETAISLIEPYIENGLSDPLVRQRLLYLSVLARVYAARRDRDHLVDLIASLEGALALRRSTGPHDFHVASYAQALIVLEKPAAARAYVKEFVARDRRDQTQPSSELRSFLR
jgi:DNA-binding SARP family transcriptional activator